MANRVKAFSMEQSELGIIRRTFSRAALALDGAINLASHGPT